MPRAVPGDVARVALRRNYTEKLMVSVNNSDSYSCIFQYRLGMETYIHPSGSRSNKWCYFTLHFSCNEVERGRLGEVVSLAGDCRPPPPGNPRRPTAPFRNETGWDGWKKSPACAVKGSKIFTPKYKNYGGVLLKVWKYYSFNNDQITNNLKILNNIQYFKNKRSYFSCTQKKHVLKFAHLHSHLCGLREVEPPSIAITNVLEK